VSWFSSRLFGCQVTSCSHSIQSGLSGLHSRINNIKLGLDATKWHFFTLGRIFCHTSTNRYWGHFLHYIPLYPSSVTHLWQGAETTNVHKLGGFKCSRQNLKKKHSCGEETLLSSGWTLIGTKSSSPNLNSSVRAERLFTIRDLNVVIKPLCGNLDICLNYCRGILNACFGSKIATESERCFLGLRFSVTLLSSLADFGTVDFGREKPKHENFKDIWLATF